MKRSFFFSEEWNDEAKAATPLGQMPVLEVDGQKYCQQTALARFVAKRHGLMGDDDLQVNPHLCL